jgi:hypothetical protein
MNTETQKYEKSSIIPPNVTNSTITDSDDSEVDEIIGKNLREYL